MLIVVAQKIGDMRKNRNVNIIYNMIILLNEPNMLL